MPPSRIQRPATTIYAIPKKGFRPPMTVVVDKTKLFVPPYSVTGKSTLSNLEKKGDGLLIAISI